MKISTAIGTLALAFLVQPAAAGTQTESKQSSGEALSARVQRNLTGLLDGVEQIVEVGVPGPLVVFGNDAFVVTSATDGKERVPLVAAAEHRGRRVVVFGHTGYASQDLRGEDPSTRRLVQNAIRWAAGTQGNSEPRVTRSWPSDLSESDVLITNSGRAMSDNDLAEVRRFMVRGGGLVICGLGWGWQQLNPSKSLHDHPWHAVLLNFGIAFDGGTISGIDPGSAMLDRDTREALHAGRALDAVAEAAQGRDNTDPSAARGAAATADAIRFATIARAARALPANTRHFADRLRTFVASHGVPTISPESPLKDPLDRLLATVQHASRSHGPSPHAAAFPGHAGPAFKPTGPVALALDASIPGWASTGLYAKEGAEIAVTIPPAWTQRGLGLRIGCHTDRLWSKAAWKRFPEISTSINLVQHETSLYTPFGGLIYLTIPHVLQGEVEITISGRIRRAPHFVRDVTPLKEWQTSRRRYDTPWAELQGKHVTLTVPSSVVRDLDDPQELMEFWDSVLEMYAELGAQPLGKRPQRIVTDCQISAGYMHSGYPIMMGLDVRKTLVDIEAMKAARHGGVWGFWHELGHNHQRPAWTFAGTTEVTCNLFSLFVQERLSGTKPIQSPRFAGVPKKAQAHIQAGAPFEQWQKKPFLALYMYAQLQDAFGWEAFQRAFATYLDANGNLLRAPKTDADKRDLWLVRMSQSTDKNLGPFFEQWGVPVSEAARAEVAALPQWMPESMQ